MARIGYPRRVDQGLATPAFLLWLVSTRWRTEVDRRLARLDLTHAQYVVLTSLSQLLSTGVRPSQRHLADATGLDALYVSKLVRQLDRDGLIERSVHPRDPRALELHFTPEGERRADRAAAIVAQLQDRFLAPLGGRHSQRVIDLVDTLDELLTVEL